MIIKPTMYKFLTSSIIAPHGMTDYIHAKQNNNLLQLYSINAMTTGSFIILSNHHLEIITNVLFTIASIVHFHHDIPHPNKNIQLCTVSFMLASSILFKEFFYLYMIFIHVPRHYFIHWKFMKKDFVNSFSIIAFGTFISIFFTDFFENMNFFEIVKAIVVSHILYEERYLIGE